MTCHMRQLYFQITTTGEERRCRPLFSREDARRETQANYAVFVEKLLPDLLKTHPNEWALLRNRQLVGVFPTGIAANQAGRERFPDRRFSLQEITDRPLFVT